METPRVKRARLSEGGTKDTLAILRTPKAVLREVQKESNAAGSASKKQHQRGKIKSARAVQALCSCVVAMASHAGSTDSPSGRRSSFDPSGGPPILYSNRALENGQGAAGQGGGGDLDDSDAADLLKSLLEEHVDPNYAGEGVAGKMGGTPLYLAAKLDVPAAAQILVDHGASLVQDFEGQNPFQVAVSLGHSNVADIMCKHIGVLEESFRSESRKR
uniref:Uncharacterized protein n=1 Tax=Fibrocapsa japonica TaxID=94617 RepID=A0A7S2XW44_9STRA|mmetsp:Transcript_14363/g.21131  ORF Transcript_14363/g.21131 Transcript_14363/m.21131 type:complete len:217 (+) Transcript_14363:65-715(+)